MRRNQKKVSAGGMIILLLVLVNVVLLEQGYVSGSQWYKPVLVTLPLLLIAVVLRWRKII